MLSIPFSILGNIHRLVRMSSRAGDPYHQDVLGLAQSIMAMWFWNPDTGYRFPPELDIARNGEWPLPCFDPSRDNIKFKDHRGERFPFPRLSPSPSPVAPSGSTLYKTSKPIILGSTDAEYNQDDGLYAVPREENFKQEFVAPEDTWAPFNSETFGSTSSSRSKLVPKLPDYAPQSPLDVEAWRREVPCSTLSEENIVFQRTPFVKGLDTHESVNDRLFRSGLLHPLEWLKYLHLEV
ncbi:hypothetical protein BT96DRAFT_1026881 [Gymnopus androsaceus JB14]|uniref:Uncharacterized protein n=1 Tax=Gymnopus androsaceus JB14 TaxID=1447944 RepID=A0A6A4GFY4_9AGAR|nr:hypothetical protein BT96DRAFT_1026881 [Gymnopus androsaceus JB14]